MAGRLDYIRKVFSGEEKPLKKLWNWARQPKRGEGRKRQESRLRRWRSLQQWAGAKKDNAVGNMKDVWRKRFQEYRHRARSKLEWLKNHEPENKPPSGPSGPMEGTTMVDGRVVPTWMATWVFKIRARGRWSGIVVSGVRTPAYSQQLCYNMCGRPACPGTCAGVNSNHNATPPVSFGEGAIDVSDYYVFAAEARAVGAPFHNALPNDRVHFSRSGG